MAPNPIIDTLVIDSVPYEALVKMESINKDTTYYWMKTNGFEIPRMLKGYIQYMGRDTLGLPMLTKSEFEFPSKIFSSRELKDIKKAARKNKVSLWIRIKNWFRFRYNRQQKLEKKAEQARIEGELLVLGYDFNAIDSLGVKIPIPDSIMQLVTKLDTTNLSLDSLSIDSLSIDSLAIDSIAAKDSTLNLNLKIDPSSELNPRKDLFIITETPLDSINMDLIKLYRFSAKTGDEDSFNEEEAAMGVAQRDSTEEKIVFVRDTLDILRHKVDIDWVPNAEYEFRILPRAFIDIHGNKNDSIKHKLKTVQTRDMAIINIKATNVKQSYIMDVVTMNNITENSMVINKDSTYVFDLIPAESYRIRFTKDDNGNGVFDNGNLLKRMMPEEIEFFVNEKGESEIKTRKNFDYEVGIDVGNVFDKIKKVKELPKANDILPIPKRQNLAQIAQDTTKNIVGNIVDSTEIKMPHQQMVIKKADNSQTSQSISQK